MRIQSIVNELGGEKIDVVEWNPDTASFIANALSPAKVSYVVLGDPGASGKTATVVVPDDQLSLAIGKEGQNARLGAKLTGWRIDIKSASEASKDDLKPSKYAPPVASKERDILAMAEAILLGKQAELVEPETAAQEMPEPVEAPVVESKAAPVVAEAEPQPVEESSSVLVAAEALLSEAESAIEVAAVEQVEAVAPEAPTTVAEPKVEPKPEPEAKPEPEPEPVVKKAAAPAAAAKAPAPKPERRARYRYVEDERLEAVMDEGKKKPERRSRRRELVLDEESGQVISRRRHKKGGAEDEFDWEDVDF
jgi:N utilization substance protein A